MVRTILILLTFFLLTNFACTAPIRLTIDRENGNDTIFVFTDAELTQYNPQKSFVYHPDTRLYEYVIKNDDERLTIFSSMAFKTNSFEQCKDSVKKHLPVSYLKVVGKSYKKTYIHEAKNKSEIIDFFKNGNNGNVTLITYEN